MSDIKTYKDLLVWQKSVNLSLELYKLTEKFPDSEKFGIINQIRRASISISSNIAEGWGRNSTKNYIQFLRMSRGSLLEIESTLYISEKLNYLNSTDYSKLCGIIEEISKMLNKLISTLETKINV